MPDCIFCKIIKGEISATKVYEDEQILAFNDISPSSPTHILLIPKTHYDSLREANKAILGELLYRARELAQELGISETGFRTVINTGKQGGQTVAHLHLHLLGGRNHNWPPG